MNVSRFRFNRCNINVSVNVHVYSPDIPVEFSRLCNLHPWYWNSLLFSLISSGENSAFTHVAAATANPSNLAFLFYQVRITAEWTEAAWYERLAQHLYTWPCATTCVRFVIVLARHMRHFTFLKTISMAEHWQKKQYQAMPSLNLVHI